MTLCGRRLSVALIGDHIMSFILKTLFRMGFLWTAWSVLLLINLFMHWFGVYIDNTLIYIRIPENIHQTYVILMVIVKCILPAFLIAYIGCFVGNSFSRYHVFGSLSLNYVKKRVDFFLNRMTGLFLDCFSVAFLIGSFSFILGKLKYLTFTVDSTEGFFYITMIDGLAFPTFEMHLLIMVTISVAVILTILISLLISNMEIDHEKDSSCAFSNSIILAVTMLSIGIILGTDWAVGTFGNLTADQLFFQINVPQTGVNEDFLTSIFIKCIIPTILISTALAYSLIGTNGVKFRIRFCFRNKYKYTYLSSKVLCVGISFVLLFSAAFHFNRKINAISYISDLMVKSSFIDENYIDPRGVSLVFPEKKRNLVYVFAESMETTYLSYDLGGCYSQNTIPELSDLALNNVNFTNSDHSIGGALQLSYTGWTIAGMVAQHAGLPLKLPIQGNSYGDFESFLPGTYALGDILEDNGYNQTLIVGSDAAFGGRKEFYTQHGNFKVLDLFTAEDDGIIPPGYRAWWGFEDQKLFQYAKTELIALSQEEEPFHLTLLTADTHHVGGYVCSL